MTSLALLFCALVASAASPQLPARSVPSAPPAPKPPAAELKDSSTAAAPDWSDVESTLGGRLFSFGSPFLQVAPTRTSGIFHLSFNGTGTGWQEDFLVGVPPVPLAPAPLVVLFHGYDVSEYDCVRNTGLMKRAMERGWYAVAPRGAHDKNYGVPYSQQNVEFVLDWLMATLDVDPARVYGVGFSMGGGGAASYAARHLDPAHACFAALVDHTGTVSVSHTYYNSSPAGMAIFENPLMFGGSPTAVPFAYQRVSTIELAFPQGPVDPATDMARNLKHVPMQVWTADADPLRYLLTQSQALYDWMRGVGGAPERFIVSSSLHSWRILDENAVLDFLGAHALGMPAQGTNRLMADRDARWMHFDVQQDAPGAFTPFRWNFDAAQNRIVIDQTLNLKRITVHTASIGLDTTHDLRAIPGTQDGLPEQLAFDGYSHVPSDVRRNTQSSANWTYDPVQGVVTLFESNATNYPQWVIVP